MAKTPDYNDILKKRGKAVRTALKDYAMNEREKELEAQQKELENKALEKNKSTEEIRDENKKEQEAYKKPKEGGWWSDFGKGFKEGLGRWGKIGEVFKNTETRASAYENTKPTPIKDDVGMESGGDISIPSSGTASANVDENAPKGVKQTEPLHNIETVTKDVIDYDIDKATNKAIASLKSKYSKVDPHLRERLPKTIIGAYMSGFGANDTPAEIRKAKTELKKNIAGLNEEYDKKLMDAEFDYKAGKMSEADYTKTVSGLNAERKDKIEGLNKDYKDTFGASDKANKQALFYFMADAIAKGLKGFKVAGATGGGGEAEKPAYQTMLEGNLAKGLESYNKRFDSEVDSIVDEIKGSQAEKDRIRNTFSELYADESLKPVLQNLSVYNKKRLANILREYGNEVSIGDVAAAAKGAFLLESGTSPETVKNLLSNAGEGAVKLGGLLMGAK